MSYGEGGYEQAVLDIFDMLGYEHLYGPDIERDYRNPLYMDALVESLSRVNPGVPSAVLEEAIQKLRRVEHGTITQQNKQFSDWLQGGMEVSYMDAGEVKTEIIKLIDYQNLNNNKFQVINQWTFIENETKRPDVVVFVNGLPLVMIELKSPTREEVELSDGYRQIKNYMKEIPSLFTYNAFCVISDLVSSKAGTISANEDRYMEWRTVDGNYETTRFADWTTLFQGMFQKERFLDLIKNFLLFSKGKTEDIKILAAYHQYFAVKSAIESTKTATETDGKGGVFWHTQGSGKSLSMVFYAKQLQEALDSPTIVVITDRNDLDDQLYGQFAACKSFLRQTPEHAKSRAHLHSLLNDRQANGIFFTTMQKFEEIAEPLSERRNIIVLADEAHRGQYGLTERIKQDGTIVKGSARIIRDSLPNATFIGFTGTPIAQKDRNTREVFGDYIDIYDMTQAVDDGATRPVFYESRVINLGFDEEVLKQIDQKYDLLSLRAEERDIERSKKELGKMESILAAPQTIDTLCRDIIQHYEDGREHLLTGKAMIVAYSRPIALEIYKKILELRPNWTEKVKVVMTSGNNDPEEWREIIGNKAHKAELAKKFKDDNDPMKIAIVVDMWLTGFDVPSLATMYVYKPMAGHNLMQAIARVNRVFKDKEGGLVVDYIGIAQALKRAMNDYTVRDQSNFGDPDIAKTALPKFREKLQVCKDLFYKFDFSAFVDEVATDLDRANAIAGGMDFIFGKDEEEQKLFQAEALYLKQAQTLCQSLLDKNERMEAAFFEAVRGATSKVTGQGMLSFKEINQQVSDLLEQAIHSDGVINLFSSADEEFSLFDPTFLEEVAKMKEKNLATELLRKLLNEQIRLYTRTNLVQSEIFSERMQKVMNLYRNSQITNAEAIEELLKMAEEIKKVKDIGKSLGFSEEELAFYDALTRPEAIKDFYSNEELKQMTQELVEMLRNSRTVDWQKRESARAQMRVMVKRLLKKYDYPPEEMKDAIQTVIRQCEQWADVDDVFEVPFS